MSREVLLILQRGKYTEGVNCVGMLNYPRDVPVCSGQRILYMANISRDSQTLVVVDGLKGVTKAGVITMVRLHY